MTSQLKLTRIIVVLADFGAEYARDIETRHSGIVLNYLFRVVRIDRPDETSSSDILARSAKADRPVP